MIPTTIDDFVEYVKNEKISILTELKANCDNVFFNTGNESELTDEQYDFLKETLSVRDKNFKACTVGVKLRDGENRVKLPEPLWSMDKASDEKKLNNWIRKNELSSYIVEEKLDGVSCLVVYKKDEKCRLYTRGDGVEGADISYIKPYLNNVPDLNTSNITVRGELIIPRDVFAKKYAGEFANARNMVSGCVNAKSLKTGVEDIHFVVYEIIDKGDSKKHSDQLDILTKLGFETVGYSTPTKECNYQNMKDILTDMKYSSMYEIDGIIIQPNIKYTRCLTGNPKYAIAFKQQFGENISRTKIIAVHWEATKWKQIKPRVEIEPVELSGVVIRFVTAYNAKYVVDNMIGVGAVIDVTRSGDVIPKIVSVVEEAKEPDMPLVAYNWNETHVDIYTSDDQMLSDVKMTTGFFEKLGVKHVGEKSVQKLYEDGYDSLIKILEMTEDDMAKIDGFGVTLAKRTYTNIHNSFENTTVDVLLGSSGVLGYGFATKKVSKLLNDVPDLMTASVDGLLERIIKADGFSEKSAKKVIEHLPKAREFMTQMNPYIGKQIIEKKPVIVNNITVVISGFRDKEFEKQLIEFGYTIGSTVTKNTNYVITVPDCKPSSKITKARELNIEIINRSDFNIES
jgi:DNA ligase (NAD+)